MFRLKTACLYIDKLIKIIKGNEEGEESMQKTLLIWIAIMSVWAFLAMGFDKGQAQKKGARVPERNLWLLAMIGGGIGAYFGLQVFRHKTRKTSFRVGFLMLALAYSVLILYLLGVAIPGVSTV